MSRTQRDFLTEAGANELAYRVRRHWLEQGYHVDATVHKARGWGENRKSTSAVFGVKSNLINGLPLDHALHKKKAS